MTSTTSRRYYRLLLALFTVLVLLVMGHVSLVSIIPQPKEGVEDDERPPVMHNKLFEEDIIHHDPSSCIIHNSSSKVFQFQRWSPHNNTEFTWKVMSTRQNYPGAINHPQQPQGFPARCDWVINDWIDGSTATLYGDLHQLPRTVFVRTPVLQRFHNRILPCFPSTHRLVLLTGGSDKTVPRQTDQRSPGSYQAIPRTDWLSWLNDPRIVALFVENLDEYFPQNSKVHPLSLGLNAAQLPTDPDTFFDSAVAQLPARNISQREIRMLFSNRVRGGTGQWKDRARAAKMCQALPHCEIAHFSINTFFQKIQTYPFLLCVHGGGLEPNPNLYTALLAGVIPIIAPFPGQSMYEGLPIVITDGRWDHESEFFSWDYLTHKRSELAPYFEDPWKRSAVLEKLTSKYWWNKVEDALANINNGTNR
jgi:hypothetical protein